ncbi:uncharacterized protein LOC111871054 [Cryptotermes secundus]|uniref:uncharacterized protein LOC111871054 n=1 Tax=Cryptotermes secundus TaxID=105785 RepID=UPI001454BD74|nr:uncharacterized protein LOC111871054 [Cryptotermes secundus]
MAVSVRWWLMASIYFLISITELHSCQQGRDMVSFLPIIGHSFIRRSPICCFRTSLRCRHTEFLLNIEETYGPFPSAPLDKILRRIYKQQNTTRPEQQDNTKESYSSNNRTTTRQTLNFL